MKEDGRQSSKDDRGPTRPWHVFRRWSDGAVVGAIRDLPKLIAFNYRYTLTELRLTKVESGWRLILKARNSRGKRISITTTEEYDMAIELVTWETMTGNLAWKEDKPPPWEKEKK